MDQSAFLKAYKEKRSGIETVDYLTSTMAPYLTMAEGLKLVALGYDKDISKLSCWAG